MSSIVDPETLPDDEQRSWLAQQNAAWTEDDFDLNRPLLVVFDLDGTLLDSMRVVQRTVRALVERRGLEYTDAIAAAGLGLRPREATEALIAAAGGMKGATVDEVAAEASAAMTKQWDSCELMPGAERLLTHLASKGVPMCLATNAPADSVKLKTSRHPLLRTKEQGGVFTAIVTGDQVSKGKPHPEIFLTAMQQSGVTTDPNRVVVVEDAPAGVQAAMAAGMKVVAVPSLVPSTGSAQQKADPKDFAGSAAVLSCLYDWRPEDQGLPPFVDRVGEVVALGAQSWRAKGCVVKGFGRGSKELGIPTANLPPSAWDKVEGGVCAHTSGIYAGWASKGDDPTVYPTALSVGWNPHFKGAPQDTLPQVTDSHSSDGKTLEPWLLHDFDGKDFYGEELRLVVCGYIRPEAPFTTVEALVDRIYQDADATKVALGLSTPQAFTEAALLAGGAAASAAVGSGGGANELIDSTPTSSSSSSSEHTKRALAAARAASECMARGAFDAYLRPPGWGAPSLRKHLLCDAPALVFTVACVALLACVWGADEASSAGTGSGQASSWVGASLGWLRSAGTAAFGFTRFRRGVLFGWGVHSVEAAIAFRTATKDLGLSPAAGIGWAALTQLNGFFSLGKVLSLKKPKIGKPQPKKKTAEDLNKKGA